MKSWSNRTVENAPFASLRSIASQLDPFDRPEESFFNAD
jgi:hypothetical protein